MINYVSIDFSLNSTGMTIFNGTKYIFFSFVNTDSFYGKKGNVLSEYKLFVELENYVKIIKINRSLKNDDYCIDQDNKLNDANTFSDLVLNEIPENSIIAIEGFSYSSISNSFIDLIMFNSVLRHKVIQKKLKLFVYSPSEIKKFFCGKGNADKLKVLNSFKSSDDELLKQTDYYKFVLNNNVMDKKGVKIISPITDINDSYAINKLLQFKLK